MKIIKLIVFLFCLVAMGGFGCCGAMGVFLGIAAGDGLSNDRVMFLVMGLLGLGIAAAFGAAILAMWRSGQNGEDL